MIQVKSGPKSIPKKMLNRVYVCFVRLMLLLKIQYSANVGAQSGPPAEHLTSTRTHIALFWYC